MSLSQSERAETGQVAEEDLRESRQAGQSSHARQEVSEDTHTHTFNSVRSQFPSEPMDVLWCMNVDLPAQRLLCASGSVECPGGDVGQGHFSRPHWETGSED